MPDTLHDLYRRWLDELWGGRTETAPQLVADDFVGHWPQGDVHGPEELAAIIHQTHQLISGLSFRLEVGPLAEGDLVAARWTGAGQTEDGDVRFTGTDLLRVAGGRFTEYWPATTTGG